MIDACRAGAGDVLERNVARLFRERVTLFEEVELTQSSIMAGKPHLHHNMFDAPWYV